MSDNTSPADWLKEAERLLGSTAMTNTRSACLAHLAAQAAPAPLTDERIDAAWNALDGKRVITGENQLNWNRALRRAFAREIEAALAAPGVPPPDAAQAPDEVVADYQANIRAYLQEGAPGVPPQPTSGVLAGALTAPEYLAKIEADPAKSAALQRARDRAADGVRVSAEAQLLDDLRQVASEAGDHTRESFARAVIRLANRAHKLTPGVKGPEHG